LKVPFYLVFYPDNQEMTLFRRGRSGYASVKPNRNGRCPIPKLELEVALLDGWVRYWYQGELLPLPADLQKDLEEAREQLAKQKRRARRAERRAEEQTRRAEEETRRAEQEKQARLEAEAELARVRSQLQQLRDHGG
jgi:hypothetical protein